VFEGGRAMMYDVGVPTKSQYAVILFCFPQCYYSPATVYFLEPLSSH
jgi:hypothetical protein